MVELRLTIAGSHGQRDVVIRAAAGCRWQQVQAVDTTIPLRLYAGSQPITPDAIVGVAPLVHGALLSTERAVPLPRHLLELRVVGGVDCGLTVPLGAADVIVGRGAGAALRLTDVGVSREHVTVRLRAGLVTVTDLSSTNGCRVDGRAVAPRTESPLNVGSHLEIGATRILLARNGIAPAFPEPAPPIQVTVPVPRVPETPERRSWPILLAAAPLLISGVAAVLLHNPMFLVFALLSPVMVLSQYLSDRRGGSRSHWQALARYEAAAAEADRSVSAALHRERTIRERRAPPLGEVVALATAATSAERDAGLGIRLRIGVGTVASCVLRRPEAGVTTDAADPEALPAAPVELDLTLTRRLIVTGPLRHRVADAIAVQLATWYPHTQVRLQIVCRPEQHSRWEWLRMLPHVLADPGGTPGLSTSARELPTSDAASVCILDEVVDELPTASIGIVLREQYRPEEGVLCIETAPGGVATVHHVPGLLGPVRLDLAAPGVPERCARALAGTLGAVHGIAASAGLGDLYRTELSADITDPVDVQRLWAHSTDRVLVGSTASGPFSLDLPSGGPHALVAGTTGSGKSALLQTFLVSWALRQPADRLSFVLVDYKGGAAFAACAQLPHTVGLVTDLDAALTGRALTSLQAEIHRREQLLSSVGAADFDSYQKLDPATRLARVVIVIDEFRALADELPQFVQGLVRVAAVGRSLGIHLVLATQRPAGIVSADIRANVDIRIALRTTDRGDSQDVIGSDAAARLDPSTPGRAIVQVAGDAGTPVQITRILTSTTDVPLVRAVDPITGTPIDPAGTGDDLPAVVSAIRQANLARGNDPAHRPWLPPLPTEVAAPPAANGRVVLGVVDRPEEQRQETAGWDPADGNLLIVGGPGSGRTTTLTSIALASGMPTYFIGSTTPQTLPGASHIGAVGTFDEPARLTRLFDWLDERIRDGSGDPVRVLVDDWDALQDRVDPASMAVADRILRVMRDGPRAGVVMATAGGRAVVSGRVAALARRRICLTAVGADDLLLLGVRPDRIPSARVPGRGILLPDGYEIQCALPGTPPPGSATAVRFDPLPARVDAGTLPVDAFGSGLDGPIGWQPGERAVLSAGPPGSGRSTALATIATQFLHRGTSCGWLGAADGPGGIAVIPADPAAIRDWVTLHPGGVLCVDDLERYAGTSIDQTLLSINDIRLFATTTTDAASAAFTGTMAALRRSGTGLLLQPGRRDGEVFGVSLATSYDEGPGSGVIVRRGRITQVRLGMYQTAPDGLL